MSMQRVQGVEFGRMIIIGLDFFFRSVEKTVVKWYSMILYCDRKTVIRGWDSCEKMCNFIKVLAKVRRIEGMDLKK